MCTNLKFKSKGFSLTEIIIAVAVLGLVIVTICGVFVRGLHSIKKSKYKAAAIHVANQKFAELTEADWSCGSGIPVYKLCNPPPDGSIEGFLGYNDNGNDPYILWDPLAPEFEINGSQPMSGVDYDFTIHIKSVPSEYYVKEVTVNITWKEVEGTKEMELSTFMARIY